MAQDKVYLEINKAFVKETDATFVDDEGEIRNLIRVSMPKGTIINGVDFSNASFLTRYAFPSKNDERNMVISFKAGSLVPLSLPHRNADGEIDDWIKISPTIESVIKGLADSREAWKAKQRAKAHEARREAAEGGAEMAEKVYVPLNNKFVFDTNKTFTDVDGSEKPFKRAVLPKGTVIDGVDYGGSSFVARYANVSKFNEKDLVFAFTPGYDVSLSVPVIGEDGEVSGYEKVPMDPKKISDAIAASRKQWREEHKGQREDADKEADQAQAPKAETADATLEGAKAARKKSAKAEKGEAPKQSV